MHGAGIACFAAQNHASDRVKRDEAEGRIGLAKQIVPQWGNGVKILITDKTKRN